VPDVITASAIAEAVLKPIYGEKAVIRQRPYKAELIGDAWFVEGTLPEDPRIMGGRFIVRITKSDGRILELYQRK